VLLVVKPQAEAGDSRGRLERGIALRDIRPQHVHAAWLASRPVEAGVQPYDGQMAPRKRVEDAMGWQQAPHWNMELAALLVSDAVGRLLDCRSQLGELKACAMLGYRLGLEWVEEGGNGRHVYSRLRKGP